MQLPASTSGRSNTPQQLLFYQWVEQSNTPQQLHFHLRAEQFNCVEPASTCMQSSSLHQLCFNQRAGGAIRSVSISSTFIGSTSINQYSSVSSSSGALQFDQCSRWHTALLLLLHSSFFLFISWVFNQLCRVPTFAHTTTLIGCLLQCFTRMYSPLAPLATFIVLGASFGSTHPPTECVFGIHHQEGSWLLLSHSSKLHGERTNRISQYQLAVFNQ